MSTADPRRFLLDTHAFLWLAAGDDRVPSALTDTLASPQCELWLSAASVWEMAIKSSLGKLKLALSLPQLIRAQTTAMGLRPLTITDGHAVLVESLEFHHRDPFDRLLVAQAVVEDLEIVSRDEALDPYPIRRVW